MLRISVVGNSGSGKTTVAAALARALGVPHLELDSVFHQPGWEPLDTDLFRAKVAEFVAGDGWVVDGNYSAVRALIWQRADTVLWMDLPRRSVMRQVITRTLRRMATRQELWNGNTESWRDLFSLDPKRSIVLWAWTEHGKYSDRYREAQHDPANQHLTFVRLPSRAAASRFLADLAGQPAATGGGVTGGGVTGE